MLEVELLHVVKVAAAGRTRFGTTISTPGLDVITGSVDVDFSWISVVASFESSCCPALTTVFGCGH